MIMTPAATGVQEGEATTIKRKGGEDATNLHPMGIQSVLANCIKTHKELCKIPWISMMMCQAKHGHGW
jgi:hypothetical protein